MRSRVTAASGRSPGSRVLALDHLPRTFAGSSGLTVANSPFTVAGAAAAFTAFPFDPLREPLRVMLSVRLRFVKSRTHSWQPAIARSSPARILVSAIHRRRKETGRGNDRNRRVRPTGRILANMNFPPRSSTPPLAVSSRQPPPFYFRLFNGKPRLRPACRARSREFANLREIQFLEDKEARRTKRLAIDPVRFAKRSSLSRTRFEGMPTLGRRLDPKRADTTQREPQHLDRLMFFHVF
jgi:hypothetical protein